MSRWTFALLLFIAASPLAHAETVDDVAMTVSEGAAVKSALALVKTQRQAAENAEVIEAEKARQARLATELMTGDPGTSAAQKLAAIRSSEERVEKLQLLKKIESRLIKPVLGISIALTEIELLTKDHLYDDIKKVTDTQVKSAPISTSSEVAPYSYDSPSAQSAE
jgi:hypothetical protein